MNFKEIAEAKKCALTTPDWDAYQVIIRTCLKNPEADQVQHPGILLKGNSQRAAGAQNPAIPGRQSSPLS